MGELSKGIRLLFVIAVAALCPGATAGVASALEAEPGETFPISYLKLPPNAVPGSHSGTMGPGYVSSPTSTNGRYAFFSSESDNLVPDAGLEINGIYRKDRQTGDVVLVSRADGQRGAPAQEPAYEFAVSGNGNLVVFATGEKLSPGDVDDKADVYLRNISAGSTRLLTPTVGEDAFGVDISRNGAYIVFTTAAALSPGDGNTELDVYRMRLSDGVTNLVSALNGSTTAGNDASKDPSISGDGAWVAFRSEASNLVAGYVDENGPFNTDVFLRNAGSNKTYLVSSRFNSSTVSGNDDSSEAEIAGKPAALGDVIVAYTSYATNLADNGVTDPENLASVYVKRMSNQSSELVSRADGPAGANADSRAHTPSISDDGSRVVFSSDATNLGAGDDYYGVYVRDRSQSTTNPVSARNEYAVQGGISGDGSIATWIEAGGATPDSDPDLQSVFARSLPTGKISLVSRPKGTKLVRAPAFTPYDHREHSVSADGRYYVFSTGSRHMPVVFRSMGEQGVYRRDLKTGEIELVSRASGPDGVPGNGADPSISADGNVVAFTSWEKLDPADADTEGDVYVRNMSTNQTTLVSRADGADGAKGNEPSGLPTVSGDGNRVAFRSEASNLGAPGGADRIFVRDIAAGRTFVVSRATGEGGVFSNGSSDMPSINHDGSVVAFESHATNLSPADPAPDKSIYVRDLDTNETLLVSRRPGPNGASLTGFTSGPAVSGTGERVVFITADANAVPETAPWPVGQYQVVARDIADGSNRLVSISTGGQAGDQSSGNPSVSRDGEIVAYKTNATNLRADLEATQEEKVVVRDVSTGAVSGPPAFGLRPGFGFVDSPVVSGNGECIAFTARGHNEVSGALGDLPARYMFARGSGCSNPLAILPRLTAVSLKPAKFRVSPKATAKVSARKRKKRKAPRGTKIRFTLNVDATVSIRIDRKAPGRKAGKKCVKQTRKNKRRKNCTRFVKVGVLTRKDLPAGKRVVPFSGRIGKRTLRPGRYRAVLGATNATGRSVRNVARPFRIVKR